MTKSSFDVCVLGGGPAGLAAAIAIAQTGREVAIVDAATPPIDKACGEGLMPDSVVALRKLGIVLPGDVGCPFRGIRFISAESQTTALFPSGSGRGVRRIVLHRTLMKRAAEAGVHCLWGERAMLISPNKLRMCDCTWTASIIIAADGQNSAVRRASPLAAVRRESKRYGFRRHYRIAPWSTFVELYWGRNCQVYITPTATDEVCVASVSRDPHLRLDAALRQFPDLLKRIGDAEQLTPDRGALSVSRTLRSVATNGLALLGDASGSVDAATGEGLGLGFRQAVAVAEAIGSGNLRDYATAHRLILQRPRLMSELLLLLDRHPNFQRRTLAGLARHPKFFSELLAVHVGERSFPHLLPWELVHLCGTFLAA